MAIIDINLSPSTRQLRQFAAVCLVALPLVAWLWTGSVATAGWGAAAGLVLCIAGLLAPALLRPLFLGLSIVTLPIGLIAGEAAMLLIYFGVFLPMSVALKIAGRDSLQRRSRTHEDTFWQERKQPVSVRNYYHQF